MGSPTSSAATEDDPQPRRAGETAAASHQATTRVVPGRAAGVGVGRRRGGPRPSEVPPTGALTWVLGELAFYYGACCLYHHRSAPRRGRTR